MQIRVHFFSYFKDLTACSETIETLPTASTLGELIRLLSDRFPKLGAMQKSMLIAVGVEYQTRDYILREGDQVSLFPPVQGG